MPGPQTPAIAAAPVPPPISNLAFVNPDGRLSPPGLEFLQFMWAAIFGDGGIVNLQLDQAQGAFARIIGELSATQAQSDQQSPLAGLPGRLTVLEQRIATLETRLSPVTVQPISGSLIVWTPTLAGATTAGTQTYSKQWGAFINIGPAVLALFQVVMTAKDAATAGALIVSGLPIAANTSVGANQAGWVSEWTNFTLAGAFDQIAVQMNPGSTNIAVIQNQPGGAAASYDSASLVATSALTGGVIYFR